KGSEHSGNNNIPLLDLQDLERGSEHSGNDTIPLLDLQDLARGSEHSGNVPTCACLPVPSRQGSLN
ncbi:MAG: hypothetical protein AAFN65_14315, partial [Bacteroidota bacterium]